MASPDGLFSMNSIRRSLRISKKDKEKEQKKEKEREGEVPELPEKEEEEEEKKEVVDRREEISEFYTLPELLSTPLSVMEINKLIEKEILEEAHLNLLSLRQDFQEAQRGEEKGSTALCMKEKDLHLLYRELRDKVTAVVRDSSDPRLLVGVARIVQEEERREGQPGGLTTAAAGAGGWREVWREAVAEGVRATVARVPLEGPEQNPAWLGVHLGLLGQTLVRDLEKVRTDLRWSYPPSFEVFGAYVGAHRAAVGQHVARLRQRAAELKDLHALLDWVLNSYQSEKIMGSPCLLPEMQSESTELVLDEAFLDQLRDQYCSRLQIDLRFSLGKIIEMEDEFWNEKNSYELKEGFLSSPSELDIRTRLQGIVTAARRVDGRLELKAIRSCCEELKLFPKRFEEALMSCCSSAEVKTLSPTYLVTSINTFIAVKQHMEQYRASCPGPVAEFSQEVDSLLGRLALTLEDQYKTDIKPYMRRMMSRKWMTNDEDFQKLQRRTEQLSDQCSQMRPPTVQALVDRLHHHTVKEYVSQLMKNSYSCKSRKHQKGAEKLRRQWAELRNLFIDMKSTHEWLHPLGDHLSDIIGPLDKRDIKHHLHPLVEQYPDLREKHLVAVLYFRGLTRGRERQAVLQHFTKLQKTAARRADGAGSQSLFRDIQPAGNPGWRAQLPFSCMCAHS